MHKKLIKQLVKNEKQEDMEYLEYLLDTMICELKELNKTKYDEIEFELYRRVYGDHLNEDLAKKWVAKMKNKDGTTGEHWSFEQTSQYAGSFDKNDWYAVLNMMYSDYYTSKFDTSVYVELAKNWLDDEDVGKGKTLKYYMFVVCD